MSEVNLYPLETWKASAKWLNGATLDTIVSGALRYGAVPWSLTAERQGKSFDFDVWVMDNATYTALTKTLGDLSQYVEAVRKSAPAPAVPPNITLNLTVDTSQIAAALAENQPTIVQEFKVVGGRVVRDDEGRPTRIEPAEVKPSQRRIGFAQE